MARVVIQVDAQTAQFQQSMERVRKDMQGTFAQAEKEAKKYAVAIGSMVAAGASGLALLTKHSIEAAGALAEMSQKVGVSVESLSTLKFAAEQSGVSVEKLQGGLVKLAKNASDASQGIGTAVDGFDALGISVKNADGSLKGTDVLLREIATQFASYEDGANKTALAVNLFGRAGADLIPLLNEGADGIATLEQRARDLGLELSTNTARQAEALGDQLDELKSLATGLGNDIATQLVPSLNTLVGGMVDAGIKGREAGNGTQVFANGLKVIVATGIVAKNAIEGVTNAIASQVDVASAAATAVRQLADASSPVSTLRAMADGSFVAPTQALENFRRAANRAMGSGATGIQDAIADVTDAFEALWPVIDKNTGSIAAVGTAGGKAAPALVSLSAAASDAAQAEREREKALKEAMASQNKAVDAVLDLVDAHEQEAQSMRLSEAQYAQSISDMQAEVRILSLSGAERERAIILLQAERMARQQTAVSVAEATEAYRKELQALADAAKAEENARQYEGIWESAAQSMAEYLTGGARDGADGVMDIMQSLASELQSYWAKNAIVVPIQQRMQGGGGGLAGFGQALNTNSMYGEGGTGSTAGGWMSAAGSAFGGWEAAQEGNALGTVAGFTAAGAQIGGVYGAIVGAIVGVLVAVFKDVKPPDLRIGAEGYTRKPEVGFDTVFGPMQVGVRGGVDEHSFIDAVTQFDEAIAGVIRTFQDGEAQFEEVRDRLSTWSLDLRGMENITGEAVLEARFDAILGTFDQAIQQYVRSGDDLEAQVQRLSDAAFIEAAAIQGDLLPTFTELAEILEANRAEGEAITAVYERLRGAAVTLTAAMNYSGIEIERVGADFIQFAADAVTAAGGLDRFRALVDSYFQTFYTEAERNVRNLDIARVNGAAEFADIELDLADYIGAGGAQAFRELFESKMPSLSAEALVEWYEAAQALGIVLDLQQQVTGAVEDTTAALEAAAEAEQTRIDAMHAYADTVMSINRQLYELSGATEYRQSIADINEQYQRNITTLQQQAVAAGLSGARTEDLTAAMQLQLRMTARATAELRRNAQAQADALGYTPLGMIETQIAELQASEQAAADSMQRFADSMRETGRIASDVAAAMLGEGSPLEGQGKADYALRALEDGAISLDAALSAGREVFATGRDWDAFFKRAIGIAESRPRETEESVGQSVSFAMRELLEEQARLQEEAARAQRFTQAQDFVRSIADLSFGEGQDFQSVLDSLGVNLDALLRDLGFTEDTQLGELIAQMQSEQDALALWLSTNVSADGRYIVEALNNIFNQQTDPLLEPPQPPSPELPDDKDPVARPKSAEEIREEQAADNKLLREEVVALRADIARLLREGNASAKTTADGVTRIARQKDEEFFERESRRVRVTGRVSVGDK